MAAAAAPVVEDVARSDLDVDRLLRAASEMKAPLADFLRRHAHAADVRLFVDLARRGRPADQRDAVRPGDPLVLLPAFVVTELTEAFEIGFLVFLPFLVVELVVANLLLALGMHMLSPTAVSMPFKLLLFVLVDGWALLARGLVLGYV
jgi:type III secretion protein R